jgi:Endonuclease/Exonuclease/phosphatase family
MLNRGEDPKVAAVVQVIVALNADVLLLTAMDYDLRGAALTALADRLAIAGAVYPHRLALRPNTGVATGLDLDGNGRFGEPRDAMGYGHFAGEGGMALLSRFPIDTEKMRDFSGFLWVDLPNTLMPDNDPAIRALQMLSTTGMYEVPVLTKHGPIRLLAYYATPPVFDGPEDRNGRRNHDETAFWTQLIAGNLPFAPPKPPFVVLRQSLPFYPTPPCKIRLRAAATGAPTRTKKAMQRWTQRFIPNSVGCGSR